LVVLVWSGKQKQLPRPLCPPHLTSPVIAYHKRSEISQIDVRNDDFSPEPQSSASSRNFTSIITQTAVILSSGCQMLNSHVCSQSFGSCLRTTFNHIRFCRSTILDGFDTRPLSSQNPYLDGPTSPACSPRSLSLHVTSTTPTIYTRPPNSRRIQPYHCC
jgi:hypothetical protein